MLVAPARPRRGGYSTQRPSPRLSLFGDREVAIARQICVGIGVAPAVAVAKLSCLLASSGLERTSWKQQSRHHGAGQGADLSMSKSRAVTFVWMIFAASLLTLAATPSEALTFSWSFVTTPDSDNPGETVSGLIWGLHEGSNDGSGVSVSVTSTPTGELKGLDWDFYSTLGLPAGSSAFTVSGGVLTYANAAFLINGQLGGPELILSLNDTVGYSSPQLDDQDNTWWFAGFGDGNKFTPRTLNLDFHVLSWTLLAALTDPKSATYDERYLPFLDSVHANQASIGFAAAPEVPLPAALPLLASGLGGLGLLGWRRKRKANALAA